MVREDDDLESLLRRCASGDERALKALFDAEASRMKGIAMRVLHRSDMAEEAVQEAFLQIWRNARRFDPALGSARAWMCTIARFRAIDLLRSRPQEDALAPEDLDRLREAAVDHAWETLDRDGRLAGCLEAIEAAPRRSLLLSYVVGLTQEEIAGKLGRPLGTVKSWMRRALLSLRECLG